MSSEKRSFNWGAAIFYVSICAIISALFDLIMPFAFIPGVLLGTVIFYVFSRLRYKEKPNIEGAMA